ncbi:hypothetical protein BKX95_00035 [Streptococcus iniae]|nr:hypothetical protein BKX95_00035 [Streptococcus iniae]
MKKQNLILLIGSLLIMIMMTACKDSKIPENRTKEEYQAEQNFKPFFEFLAQKDKDLSKIQKYLLLVSDSGDALDLDYLYSIQDLKNSKNSGKFETRKSQIEQSGGYNVLENKEVPFEYSKNSIVYPKGKPNITFDDFIIGAIDTKELKKLKVKSYLLKHPETELKDITYELPTQSKLIKKMQDKYKISDIKEADITFTKSGKNNFDYTLRIKTKNKRYYLGETYSFRK